jgi:hypothetical protein
MNFAITLTAREKKREKERYYLALQRKEILTHG